MVTHAHCPDCGTELASDGASAGLCARCLLSLALVKSVLDPGPEADSEAPTLEAAPGRILGKRYQMREMLGQGGMGEVWRAFDLKLRVDVALKSVRTERQSSAKARDLLRQEVRSAREVVSPNVCRIFDLVEEDGRELVSMEYIDGTTLTETLRDRGPLELPDAREIASQFLAGLEAIHQAGLVHRDFKPENVMLTRAGRVVVMDFGLAKELTERGTGTVAGTPAYMAPEQSRGDSVDARADVYAAGVVLAELLTVGGSNALTARRALWKAVREAPPRVPDGPWAALLRQALDPRPEGRPESARALARSLEEVTLRLPGFEEERPYPGLASFTEEDAEYFYGREAEVEAVWLKLKRPRLLALIGPSGTGKSSFIRAGLLATLPHGWAAVVTTPGHRPLQSLAQALAPSLAGDAEAVQSLVRFEEADTAVGLVARWRQRQEHALVVVDQFEELFTLTPPETQAAFAELLGRLVLEADVHVLLSLRDDFLFQCHSQGALGPAFADLTPLGTLGEAALRRALVQPALSCGYRFEDEALVDEMIAEVGQERGALPLLAFAASRLWEKRDREQGLLTREAYTAVGGVAGALAQHAEATLERIGTHRTPLVRELFRNLVTAQGTRAVRERVALLSVFDQKEQAEAEEVLTALVDARLLTSFERAGDETGEGRQEIEIIHESLLSRWPRLVRWQTQDADGAQLRDQVRQAAQAWEDRGRPEDLLWSGTAYRDFALWRERYSGGLTAAEEAFGEAAERLAGRRRRRRRLATAGLVSLAAVVAIVTSVLWQRSEAERQRAEASKLLALGQVHMDEAPTDALAYAMKSLELADTPAGRVFAVRALQRGPTATVFRHEGEVAVDPYSLSFSATGEWLATGGFSGAQVLHRDGGAPTILEGFENLGLGGFVNVAFTPEGDRFVTVRRGELRGWSAAQGRELWKAEQPAGSGGGGLQARAGALFTSMTVDSREEIRRWSADGVESRLLGRTAPMSWNDVDPTGTRLVYPDGNRVFVRSLESWDAPPRRVGEHPVPVSDVRFHPNGEQVASIDRAGEIRIWGPDGESPRVLQGPPRHVGLRFGPTGRWLGVRRRGKTRFPLWDLEAPEGIEPLFLRRGAGDTVGLEFDPAGEWLAAAGRKDVVFWSLVGDDPRVRRTPEAVAMDLEFLPDGEAVVAAMSDGTLRSWPVDSRGDSAVGIFQAQRGGVNNLAVHAPGGGAGFAAITGGAGVRVVPLDGGPVRLVGTFPEGTNLVAVALSPDARRVATAPYYGPPEAGVVRVWDLEDGAVQEIGPIPDSDGETEEGKVASLHWLDDRRILASVFPAGLVVFDLKADTVEVLAPGPAHWTVLTRDGERGVGIDLVGAMGLAGESSTLARFDVAGTEHVPIAAHGNKLVAVALDSTGTIVATGDTEGTVRVGPVTGEEPHLLLGHEDGITSLAFSPDGRWLASAAYDETTRLWPVPDVAEPPLHTFPRDELLGRLRTFTNLRVVADPEAASGYEVEPGPFPGWAEVPEW